MMASASKALARKAGKESGKSGNGDGGKLSGILPSAAMSAKIAMHNAIYIALYGAAMFLVFYADLQTAFAAVALLAGATGSYAMATAADILTTYTILGIACGFCLFFGFKAENWLIRKLCDRLWRKDRAIGEIDRGPAWRARHPEGE